MVRFDPPICRGRTAALPAHVYRQGVPAPGAFAVRTAPATQGDALFRGRTPADRAYPFRQHPRGSGHLRPADRRARHHRPVVQHAFVGTPRYDQGRDHLFQARYGQCPAIGHRALEAGLEVHRNQRAGEGAREARTRPPQGRGRGRGVGRAEEREPLCLQTPAVGRGEPREPPDGRFRLSAREARFGRTAADARARG